MTLPAVSAIVVGCGQRGTVYSSYSLDEPDKLRIVGLCDPSAFRRRQLARRLKLDAPKEYDTWQEVCKLDRLADIAIVTTPDALHAEPVIALADRGYHILCEKPLAPTEQECIEMIAAVEKAKIMFGVGHVMRYSPYSSKIHELVRSGRLGRIMNVQHLEPVGYFHFAHSYVRGNWRNEKESSFALLAKSCHDIDWLRFIVGEKCVRTSSFGSLQLFREDQKPKEANNATRCVSCPIKRECVYSADIIYGDLARTGQTDQWPLSVAMNEKGVTIEDVLEKGPYGRCVYHCDNDVVDQQVVLMEFESGVTATFSMVAHTKDIVSCFEK